MKLGRTNLFAFFLSLSLLFGATPVKSSSPPELWSKEKAWSWYKKAGVIKGFNYLPRTAVNSTDMWQASTFDPATIDEELAWARKAGYNSARVFLQYIVWKDDQEGYKKRIKDFLAIADKHKIATMFILFDDCSFANKEPYLGKQDAPVPGVHNSQWTPSPGLKLVDDQSVFPELEKYVKDIITTFKNDKRVIIWDLYNEPGNSNMNEKSLSLVEASFKWAREVNPTQPLTTGPWVNLDSKLSQRMMELSDVVSFHSYDKPEDVEARIKLCASYGRPLICTEWVRRQVDNTFPNILPIFSKYNVGWYQWGLVAGETQTYMHWGSKEGEPKPAIWQHDVFHEDGKPYNASELELVKSFTFKTKQ